MSKFNKEAFLAEISSIPSWVQTKDDLLKYVKHLKYRLLQQRAESLWWLSDVELTDDQAMKRLDITLAYDEAYNNSDP